MKLLKVLAVFIVIIGVFLIGAYLVVREAFGPKYSTIRIDLGDTGYLVADEMYIADMAEVYYVVDFTLEVNDSLIYNLGRATFLDENWAKSVRLYYAADWIILPANDEGNAKILLTNKATGINTDSVFTSQDLRYDSLWKAKHNDIPSWNYYGGSNIDSIRGDKIFVSYEYRINDYEPFKFYTQTVQYQLDTITGNLKSFHVGERTEKR